MASDRGLLALGVGVVAGVVLVWILPLAGLALVWPLLFAVPGWILVRRVAPDLPAPGAVGVAVVSSVYLSAHLVDLVARVIGFGRPAVLVSAVLLVLASALVARIRHPWLAPLARPKWAAIVGSLRADAAIWLIAVVVAALVAVVLFANGWRAADDGWISGGWNWSDLLVHVAIGSSILHGNFPPEVPYFAGEPLTYHWFADFHGAIAASASGVDLIPVYFATSALFAGVLALLVWALALRLTGARRVAVIATVLVCVGGGMGWLRLIGDLIAGGPGPTSGPCSRTTRMTTRGPTGGRSSASPRCWGRASCRTARPRWGCRGSSRSCCSSRRAWTAARRASSSPGYWPRCSRRSSSTPSRPPT